MGGTRDARAVRASGRDRSGSGAFSGRSEKGPGPFTFSACAAGLPGLLPKCGAPAPGRHGPREHALWPSPGWRPRAAAPQEASGQQALPTRRGRSSALASAPSELCAAGLPTRRGQAPHAAPPPSRLAHPLVLAAGVLAALLLAGGLAWPAPAPAAVIVQFADPSLEAAVRLKLAIPAPSPITDTDMLGLTHLSAMDKGIRSLEGLQYARNLTFVNLTYNWIRDLGPLAGMAALSWILLANNSVSDLGPLGTLPALRELDLGSNRVEDVSPLEQCTNLWGVYLYKNWIWDISPLVNLPLMLRLDVRWNPLNREAYAVHIPSLLSKTRKPRPVAVLYGLKPYPVPEPHSLGLLGAGMSVVVARRLASLKVKR